MWPSGSWRNRRQPSTDHLQGQFGTSRDDLRWPPPHSRNLRPASPIEHKKEGGDAPSSIGLRSQRGPLMAPSQAEVRLSESTALTARPYLPTPSNSDQPRAWLTPCLQDHDIPTRAFPSLSRCPSFERSRALSGVNDSRLVASQRARSSVFCLRFTPVIHIFITWPDDCFGRARRSDLSLETFPTAAAFSLLEKMNVDPAQATLPLLTERSICVLNPSFGDRQLT